MINILRTDGYKFTNLRGDPDERAIEEVRPLYEMLDWVKDWEQFLSKEVMFRSSQDSPELHHCEVTQFTQMYKRLIEFYSQDKIKVIADACRAENIVDFMNQFNEAGRAKIIEKITNRQREYFEVAPEANVWRYGNIESLNMEQYLTNLENRKEACGRLLVHVTKDSLFEHLLSDPKLKSGAMVHIAVGARSGSSRFLGERTGHYEYTAAFDQPFGISIAAHFSFDDALEYPDGQFAAVFAAEALFNNYAYSEMDKIAAQKGTDVGFGGLTNDYFNDPTHQIDIQKYGFFLVPERYQNNHLGQQLAKKGLRVFYYKGLLVDGIKELRKQIGSAEQKPKLVRELKFKRRIGVPHDVTQNKPRYAQVHIANQLEYAGEAAKKGKNIFPDDDYLVWHMGRGGGKGNYFSV